MAPGRRRGTKGVKSKNYLGLGDLVLAKVKGFPAWPAKISRPEDWQRAPDPKKCFVQFFGTAEIAFVAPVDIQIFTNEAKNKLSARCLGKTVKYFAQAVKEICEEFEGLQRKRLSDVGDDNSTQTHPPEAHSVDPMVDKALDINQNKGIAPECKLETKEYDYPGSGLEHYPHKQDPVECQDVKPYLSDDVNSRLSPPVSLRKSNKISSNNNNASKDSLSVSSPSHHFLKKEDPLDKRVKGRSTDGSQNELTNGHKPKLSMGSKKKSPGAVHRSGGSALSHDHKGDALRRKFASGEGMELSSPDIPKLRLDIISQKREKRLVKEKRQSEAVHDGQQDAKVNFESHSDAITWKKTKVQHGNEKKGSHTNEVSSPAKISKIADTVRDANLIKAQIPCKSDSRGPNVLDDKMSSKEPKRFTSVGKAEVFQSIRPPIISNSESDNDLPPIKRHRREPETMCASALISENRLETFVSDKTDKVLSCEVISPVVQLPMKRRSVRIYDEDDDDEFPKTPVHGRTTSKMSVIPRLSDSKKKSVTHGEKFVHDLQVLRTSGEVENGLKDQVQYNGVMNKLLSPAVPQSTEKRTRDSSVHVSPSPQQLNSEKLAPMEVKPVSVSPKRPPQSVGGGRVSGELENKELNKAPSSDFRKKIPAGDNKNAASSNRSNLFPNQLLSEKSKQPSSGEKKKTTPKSGSQINDSVVGASKENITSIKERLSASKDHNAGQTVDSKTSDSVMSMKHLIAAAQARKKQTHFQNTHGNLFLFSIPDIEMAGRGPSPAPAALVYEARNTLQLDILGGHPISPSSNIHQIQSSHQHENDELEERRVSSGHPGTGSSLSGGTEAAVARDTFEGMIETLSRTKESIARATRLAIDCAKYGLANEVVELLIQKLENEPSLHRRVDLFFLVDSITQCSHSQRGASYVSTVQAALPRLVGAAAPAGAGAQENRRQCRKVLRLWLERKILPESILRRYMDDFGVVNDDTLIPPRRPSRAERSIDDPIREMEGMVVDEYGSNAMFQLHGFLSASVFEEEEDEDASDTNLHLKDDDASPSKDAPAKGRDHESHSVTPSDRRHCILEEVDGELEMEDVSGHQKDERLMITNDTIELVSLELNPDSGRESSSNTSTEWLPSPEGSPPLPPGSPPMTPPLPSSPSPSSPPPPPPPTILQHPFPQPPVEPPQPPVGPAPQAGPTPPVGPPLRPADPSPIGPPLRPAGPSPPVGPPPHLHPPSPLGPHPPPFGPPPHLGPVPLISQQLFPSQPPLVSHNKTPLPSLPLSPRSSYRPHPLPHEVSATPTGNQQTIMVSTIHGSHMDIPPQQSSCFPPSGISNAREHVGYNSSRHVEYGEDDTYMNPQASQHRQQYPPGSVPFTQRPVHPELPSQRPPNHFPYPNSAQQHQYPSYSSPNFADNPRIYIADEQWRKQGNDFIVDHPRGRWMAGGRSCSGPSYSQEGYHERPPSSTINYQHSAPNSLPSSGQMPVHGVPMMLPKPHMSSVNWRPA